MSLAHSWGIQRDERNILLPCDEAEDEFDSKCTFYRAITIEATAEEIFLWLCQLRFSSCSYNLLGRSKKNALKTTLHNQPELEINQTVMDIFRLVSFEKSRQITLSIKPDAGYPLKRLIVSYVIIEREANRCRLICKANMKYKKGLLGFFARRLLPWGDLIMMRKQMLNIKRFAEEQ